MTIKEYILHLITEMPDDATWDDVRERIDFVAGVRAAMQEIDEGKGIPHARIREEYDYLTV
jgi:hypothetical protein